MPATRLVIIDTQCLLDWLVFQDPACRGWFEALGAPQWQWQWQWQATPAMKAEFDHVLGRGLRTRRPWSASHVASAWTACAHIVEPLATPPPAWALRCTDPDDQKFIDFAMARGDCHLVTRDKALLKLHRRAAERRAVRICTPPAWNEDRARPA
jgi:hypothetical protein